MAEQEGAEPEKSLDDELREQFRALTANEPADEAEKPVEKPVEEAPAEKPVEDEAKPAGERARGPDGKFAKQPTTEEVAADAKKVEAPAEKPAEGTTPDARAAKAPSSWSGKAQAAWAKLPPEVQAEVHKREADFHNGIQGYRQMAQIGQILDAEIRPYEPLIRAAGTTAPALIRETLNSIYVLKHGSMPEKQQMLLQIASEYGVDMTTLEGVAEALAAGQPAVDPAIADLRGVVAPIQTEVQALRAEMERRDFAAVVSEIEAFGNAPERAEFYPLVKHRMGQLIEAGLANDLQDAFEQACWQNPDVRAAMQAKQQADAEKQAAEKAAAERKRIADQAARSREAASTNVRPRGTPPAAPKIGTMDDTLRETLATLKSNGVL